jgi:hypothetical protein
MLDGVTAGTVAASKVAVVDADKDITGFRNVTSTGTVTAATLAIGAASLVEAELEMLDGVTVGTVAASKAVVVNADKDISSFRNLTATGAVTAGSLVIGSADISEAELETIDGITAGTVAASKALVVDSNKKLNELNIDNISINANAITTTDSNGNLELTPNGSGVTSVTGNITVTGTVDGRDIAANIPSSLSSNAGKYLKVNSGATATEWATIPTPESGMGALVDDTSPQLGGNLDVNGKDIVSVSNGDIEIRPNGTGQLLVASDTVNFTSANTQDPEVRIENTFNGATAGRLSFIKNKGAAASDNDDIGSIHFSGDNSAEQFTYYAKILAEVSTAADTDEAGRLSFFVGESNGTTSQLTAGLILEGEHTTDGEVDVTIAAGVASTTTISGNAAVVGSTTTGSLVLSHDTGGSTIDTVGTNGSGVNNSFKFLSGGTNEALRTYSSGTTGSGSTTFNYPYSTTAGTGTYHLTVASANKSHLFLRSGVSAGQADGIQYGELNASSGQVELTGWNSADVHIKIGTSKIVDIDANGMGLTGDLTATGTVTAATLAIGSASIVEAELETIDGVTAGTVAASKAVVVDSNKNISSFGTVGASTIDLGDWTISQSGSDLKFSHNGTDRLKLTSAGALTVEGDVTAVGSA